MGEVYHTLVIFRLIINVINDIYEYFRFHKELEELSGNVKKLKELLK